ncbi:MAG: LytTR family DNA-binding domain-containing protein [Bacteroidales bacterium]|nr:LytTR family DNA-binding domain-containing protein [Bacteroidales bacterium]
MNNPYKALIVDDEPSAREILEKMLEAYPEIRVIGKEPAVDKAIKTIITYHPDIVFVDIEMPEKNGIELVKEIRNLNLSPTVIFVTAYNEYAVQAIKLAAFDYILKPIDPDDLHACILRFMAEKSQSTLSQKLEILIRELDQTHKLKFNIRTGFFMIEPNEILYFMADGSYTDIVLCDEKMETISQSIGRLEEILPEQFFRINRSVIVNLTFLRRIDRLKKECILTGNGKEYIFPIPSRYIKSLDDRRR